MKDLFNMEVFKNIIKRLFAFMVDWYVSTLFAEIPVLIFQSINAKDLVLVNSVENLPLYQAIIATIIAIIIYTIYFCVLPLKDRKYTAKGQTLGKKLLQIKVVSTDNEDLSFRKLFLRDFVGILVLQGVLTTVIIYVMTIMLEFLPERAFYIIYSIYYIVFFASTVLLVLTKKHRNVQDIISSTTITDI
ncbi:MAG: RDD family protein [Erysipelotrichaceae bacterium]|nr:RDD family protein [Erysipelotrichaceae bacterium]